MTQTLYASFEDAAHAEKAAGALLDYGVLERDLSLITDDMSLSLAHETVSDPEVRDFSVPPDWQAASMGRTSASGAYTIYQEGGESANRTASGTLVHDEYDDMDEDDHLDPAYHPTSITAKTGISTTTAADAGAGAAKGAGIGLGLGLVASLASMTIPGVGLVLGGGMLATALAATAATTAAGAIAGGVTGYLKDQGVPEDIATRYHGAISGGGAILAIHVPSGEVTQETVIQIASKYGAADMHIH